MPKRKDKISFSESVNSLFKNWNVFSGRCSRREFWYGQIFLFFTSLITVSFMTVFGVSGLHYDNWFLILLAILLFLFNLFLSALYWTQFVRRYHDVGLSGHFFWFNIIGNGLMSEWVGPILNGFGFALFITSYVVASLPSNKFKEYKQQKTKKA